MRKLIALERTTRFELATPTLARLCATSCATSAFVRIAAYLSTLAGDFWSPQIGHPIFQSRGSRGVIQGVRGQGNGRKRCVGSGRGVARLCVTGAPMKLHIDTSVATAPFEQLKEQLIAQIRSGELPPGTKLPSVRKLAAEIGLAANTVARSYRELEVDGFVQTMGRNGTVVSSILNDLDAHARAVALTREYVRAMAALGFGSDELASYLARAGAHSS